MNTSTVIRPISQYDINPLQELLKQQKHDAWNPTHVIEHNEDLSGCVSIDGVPLVTACVSRDINSPFALRSVMNSVEAELKGYGDSGYFIVVPNTSPVYRFMPAGGFQAFETTLWYKNIDG